jgi:hypothetical protein
MSSAYFKMDLRDFVTEVRTNGHIVETKYGFSRKMHISYENMLDVFTSIQHLRDAAEARGNAFLIREALQKIIGIKTERDAYEAADFLDYTFNCGSYRLKDAYNETFGWVIPSVQMLSIIKQLQLSTGKRICDYGSGKGLLTYLLRKIGCNVRSVDKYINASCFAKPDVVLSRRGNYKIHSTDILLMSWGLYNPSMLRRHVRNGGSCVIIIGEDEDGCICPPYNYFDENPEWTVALYDVPNFHGIYTKMSVSGFRATRNSLKK